eukprot:3048723-Prymnesium_polylepis.1
MCIRDSPHTRTATPAPPPSAGDQLGVEKNGLGREVSSLRSEAASCREKADMMQQCAARAHVRVGRRRRG